MFGTCCEEARTGGVSKNKFTILTRSVRSRRSSHHQFQTACHPYSKHGISPLPSRTELITFLNLINITFVTFPADAVLSLARLLLNSRCTWWLGWVGEVSAGGQDWESESHIVTGSQQRSNRWLSIFFSKESERVPDRCGTDRRQGFGFNLICCRWKFI